MECRQKDPAFRLLDTCCLLSVSTLFRRVHLFVYTPLVSMSAMFCSFRRLKFNKQDLNCGSPQRLFHLEGEKNNLLQFEQYPFSLGTFLPHHIFEEMYRRMSFAQGANKNTRHLIVFSPISSFICSTILSI